MLAAVFAIGTPHGASARNGSEDSTTLELEGFLAGLPPGGVRLPVSSPITAHLELPTDRGATRLPISLHLVEVHVTASGGRFVAAEIDEASVGRLRGTLANLSAAGLSVSPTTSQTVDVLLLGSIPVSVVVGPNTTLRNFVSSTLTNGTPVEIEAAVVGGQIFATRLSPQ